MGGLRSRTGTHTDGQHWPRFEHGIAVGPHADVGVVLARPAEAQLRGHVFDEGLHPGGAAPNTHELRREQAWSVRGRLGAGGRGPHRTSAPPRARQTCRLPGCPDLGLGCPSDDPDIQSSRLMEPRLVQEAWRPKPWAPHEAGEAAPALPRRCPAPHSPHPPWTAAGFGTRWHRLLAGPPGPQPTCKMWSRCSVTQPPEAERPVCGKCPGWWGLGQWQPWVGGSQNTKMPYTKTSFSFCLAQEKQVNKPV